MKRSRLLALVIGVATVASGGGAMALEPAGAPTQNATSAWVLRKNLRRGLVTTTQDGLTLTLAFQFQGLKAKKGYRLVASSKGCAASGGVLFTRDMTTTRKGYVWDPVGIAADASQIRSIRLRARATGTTVMCSGTPAFALDALVHGIKLKGAGPIRGVVALDESDLPKQLAWSLTGLIPTFSYQLVGRSDDCSSEGSIAFAKGFTASTKGASFGRSEVLPIASAGGIVPGSIRLVAVDGPQSGSVLDCRPLD